MSKFTPLLSAEKCFATKRDSHETTLEALVQYTSSKKEAIHPFLDLEIVREEQKSPLIMPTEVLRNSDSDTGTEPHAQRMLE
mgnify:FL=1